MQFNQANAENDLKVEGGTVAAANAEHVQFPSSAGTFALRRSFYLAETGKLLLSAGQQLALDSMIRASDPEARQTKIAQHLGLVASIAGRYADRGIGLFDLVRAGNRGLIHALEKYVEQDDLPFTKFATMCITQNIELAIMHGSMFEQVEPAGVASIDRDAGAPRNL